MKILVTGGCGFIGSEYLRFNVTNSDMEFLNIDALTYAANPESLAKIQANSNYTFKKIDINDFNSLKKVFIEFMPDKVVHFAAESHVDNSISSSEQFIKTNVFGTHNILNAVRQISEKKEVQLHHISTDEVFGDLSQDDPPFNERSSYNPSSPYSSSKAASDHLVRAWGRTYGLKYTISNCSNNYGPFQHSEKLIPTIIKKALNLDKIPIYGDGKQIRDWLYVTDHIKALNSIIHSSSSLMNTYCIGGNNEIKNVDLCSIILEKLAVKTGKNKDYFKKLITFTKDRPGHDRRYAIDSSKILDNLNWSPEETFETGITKTISWYLGENK